jgi:hypothetical protein
MQGLAQSCLEFLAGLKLWKVVDFQLVRHLGHGNPKVGAQVLGVCAQLEGLLPDIYQGRQPGRFLHRGGAA